MEDETIENEVAQHKVAAHDAPQVEPLTRAEFERMLADQETRWQAQLEVIKQAYAPSPAGNGDAEVEPDAEETEAERQAREHKAAQRARTAAQTRQAVEGFGTTGTLPVTGSAAPHNPIAHINDPRELYKLARRELEQGRRRR